MDENDDMPMKVATFRFGTIADFVTGAKLAYGEKERILAVRRAELDAVKDRGRLSHESRTRNRICRLLAELFEPLDEELALAHVAARRLKKPEAALAELDQIAVR